MTDNAFLPVEITDGNLSAKLIPYGASLCDLRLSGIDHPLILGFANPADYERHKQYYFGAIIGRYAGRIANGRCSVEGQPLELDINAPPNHLHGGKDALAHRVWTLDQQTDSSVTFIIESPDGDNGYAGHVDVRIGYEILRPHILRVTITAETSHPAPLNFTHHPYFNLDGKSDYQTHKLTIAANEFLPCDNNNLPTGNIADVANTEFDFRTPKKLRNIPPLDHTFCLTIFKIIFRALKGANMVRTRGLQLKRKIGQTLLIINISPAQFTARRSPMSI